MKKWMFNLVLVVIAFTLLIILEVEPKLSCSSNRRTSGPSPESSAATSQPIEINPTLPSIELTIGHQAFDLEIANTPEKRRLGLMNRKSMAANHGMIFYFPDEQVLSFWMSNTLIPLDIIYVSAEGEVVSIHQMQPLDETSISSDHPAKYAIELNQGAAAKTGVKVGDKLAIPAGLRAR
jgi:uncharacterized protein